jgi:hypothetical protein
VEQFNYLLVIIGIILGLGITHLLAGLVEYLQHRERITWSCPQLVWLVVLFLMQVQYWYVMFSVGQLGNDFGRYLAALIFPTCLYLASGVLVPRVPPEGTYPGKFDLRARYEANRRWFFAFCIVGMLALIFYDHLVAGVPWSQVTDTLTRPDNRYRLGGLGLLGLLFCVGGWFHSLLTFLAVAVLAAFITAKTLGW